MSFNINLYKYVTILGAIACSYAGYSQSGISLYHLNNSTFQGSNFNPAYMPEGKVFFGIPVLSGITIDYNSPVNYEDAITINEAGNKEYNIDKFAADAKKRNYISLEGEISTLYLGWRKNRTSAFSFFIRERFGARGFYSDNAVNLAWHGNEGLLGDNIDLSKTAIDVRYYREYGIGIWKSIPNKALNIGVRFKFLNGMISAVTDAGMDGGVYFNQDNAQMSFNLNNVALNTSGFNLFDSNSLISHLISNGNIGFGIDLGAHWKINKQLSAAVSVNDLGFIKWKIDTENQILQDTTFRFVGLQDLGDIDKFEDKWVDALKEGFQDTTLNNAYTTGLNTSAYGSLLYQLTPNDLISGTISTHVVKGNFRTLYAVGYTRKVGSLLDVSANVSRIPQQGIDVGSRSSRDTLS